MLNIALKKSITAYHCIALDKCYVKNYCQFYQYKIIRGGKWCPPGHTSPTVKPTQGHGGKGTLTLTPNLVLPFSVDPYPHITQILPLKIAYSKKNNVFSFMFLQGILWYLYGKQIDG